jgi:outer membrane immunogenic protein
MESYEWGVIVRVLELNMRRYFGWVLPLVVSLGFGGSAMAADMAVKARPAIVGPVFSWTGFYIGGYVGGAWADRSVSVTDPCLVGTVCPTTGTYNGVLPATYDLNSSFIGGGTVGYNWQAGSWVVGVEGEGGYLHLTRTSTYPGNPVGGDTTASTKIGDAYGVVAGRVGWAFDRTLIYAKGGAVFANVSNSVSDTCVVAPCGGGTINVSGSHNIVSYAVGGGVEWAFADHWSVKGEYLYLGLQKTFRDVGLANGTIPVFTDSRDPGVHTAKIGVNYRWGGPVVARY